MGIRAGIVVTGTEVLTGRVADRNGPWLAEQLRLLGADVGQIVVVGDRRDDLRAALAYLASTHDLVITSGGLGPTADDLTAEVVGQAQGRALILDPALEQRIAAIVQRLAARYGSTTSAEAMAAGARKQAMVPAGATVLEPAGTAPGLVVPVAQGRTGPPVVVLPGPPRELQETWPQALASPAVAEVLAGATELRQTTLRLWRAQESELAALLRREDDRLQNLEITTCLRDGELEIVSRYQPDAEHAQQHLAAVVREWFGDKLFSPDGQTVDDLVFQALAERGWSVAIAEETGGGQATARLARVSQQRSDLDGVPGILLGGVVLGGGVFGPGRPADSVLEVRPGPGGPERAQALATAARTRFGADAGIGITTTGAPPDTLVQVAIVTPDGVQVRSAPLLGPAEAVRERIPSITLHTLRHVLLQP